MSQLSPTALPFAHGAPSEQAVKPEPVWTIRWPPKALATSEFWCPHAARGAVGRAYLWGEGQYGPRFVQISKNGFFGRRFCGGKKAKLSGSSVMYGKSNRHFSVRLSKSPVSVAAASSKEVPMAAILDRRACPLPFPRDRFHRSVRTIRGADATPVIGELARIRLVVARIWEIAASGAAPALRSRAGQSLATAASRDLQNRERGSTRRISWPWNKARDCGHQQEK